ncbi:potassium large conductance calcium-activated channel subfamily M alpha member 1 [Clonorchis sinensis]|uniref:BK channel n=1 Tax=Clonorchis sinensis TaxID=79923 RepID=G7YMK3_CLOSI|nr:potassium large conductance calcium-activated channel subfamily M alpha member 1 [Clonorchis sinensis]
MKTTMNTTNETRRDEHWEACMNIPRWYCFLGSSIVSFLFGIAVIISYRLLNQLFGKVSACCARTNQTPRGTVPNDRLLELPDCNRPLKEVKSSSVCSSYVNVSNEAIDQKQHGSIAVSNLSVSPSTPNVCERILNAVRACRQGVHICAVRLVSYQWLPGRIFIALSMILSLWSFGIYVSEATRWPAEVEKCGHKGRRMRNLDFLMNVFFLLHFLVRLIAAPDALIFWVDWFSILDYLTVPPTLLGFWMKRTWLGFRFVRAFRLLNLSEVLHNFNVIKTAAGLRLCHFCTLFLSIWLSGAGMFLLLENTGELFTKNIYHVAHPIDYPSALYFTIVTMSTVGYGDITPQTVLGRVFVSLFILIALATFASAIPVIVDSFFSVRKYSGSYVKQQGKSHIVVCGDITTDSVRTFLSDFLHEDRQRSDVEVVFINPCMPDLQLQSILRLHFSRVKYFQGTVMDHNDLERVRMNEADACLILASSTTTDNQEKDAANIMRVIAVKNYASHVRVIVQLLQTENKAHLFNSPYWNWDAGDEIICFSEMKLGFLAQSCVAPGFSTLITNLFSMLQQDPNWRVNYFRGASMELYSAPLSSSFEGLTFAETAVICRKKLNLLLIAVVAQVPESQRLQEKTRSIGLDMPLDLEDETEFEECTEYLAINPYVKSDVRIGQQTLAFFICDSQKTASRASVYCAECHGKQTSIRPSQIHACNCQLGKIRGLNRLRSKNIKRWITSRRKTNQALESLGGLAMSEHALLPSSSADQRGGQSETMENNGFEPETRRRRQSDPTDSRSNQFHENIRLDITGMYHCSDSRDFEDSLLQKYLSTAPSGWKSKKLVNHILLCILADKDKPLLGLHSFVMPLRASHFHTDQLKPIVILSDETYLRREWPNIDQFPDVYCLPGSPLSRFDLRTARIRFCSSCVVLGSTLQARTDDPYMMDKEVVLCSLNIRGMRFPPLNPNNLSTATPYRRFGTEIPLLTELTADANIHYLDPDDKLSGETHVPASLTAPFAQGIAFTTSVLDVLASTAYFDRNAMTLIRHLITGGVTPALEQWLAEGGGLDGYGKIDERPETEGKSDRSPYRSVIHPKSQYCLWESRQRPRVAQLSVMDPILRPGFPNTRALSTFGKLFCFAIRERGILCLGIYRNNYIDENDYNLESSCRLTVENAVTERRPLVQPLKAVAPKSKPAGTGRRLSTSAQPVDDMLRKFSLHLQRESSMLKPTDLRSFSQPLHGPVNVTNRYVITNPPNSFRLHRPSSNVDVSITKHSAVHVTTDRSVRPNADCVRTNRWAHQTSARKSDVSLSFQSIRYSVDIGKQLVRIDHMTYVNYVLRD